MNSPGREAVTRDGRAHAVAWGVVAAAYVALIFFASSRPFFYPPGPDFSMKDKLAHFLEYAVLGLLLARAFGRGALRSFAVAFLLVLAIGAGIAAADEMFQGTVPGRKRDIADWMADVSGIAAGAGVVLARRRRGAQAEERR